jgi:hypothetical protein
MSKISKPLCAFVALLLVGLTVEARQLSKSSSPDAARVYITSPANGAVVPSTFTVEFGLAGMGVAPAGMERANTGHHHLLVDGMELPSLDAPLGDAVTHFGGGQTQTRLTLPPGEHTLQLIFADHLHLPHSPPVVSEVVNVTVVGN